MHYMITSTSVVVSVIMALLAESDRMVAVVACTFGSKAHRHRMLFLSSTILSIQLRKPLFFFGFRNNKYHLNRPSLLTLFSHNEDTFCIGCNIS